MGFNNLSAWAFIKAPDAMWRPKLHKEDKQKELNTEVRLTEQEQNTGSILHIYASKFCVALLFLIDN